MYPFRLFYIPSPFKQNMSPYDDNNYSETLTNSFKIEMSKFLKTQFLQSSDKY